MNRETKEANEDSRRGIFNSGCFGIHPWKIAKALNRLTPGHDYRGMTKKALREEWATGYLSSFNGQSLRRVIAEELASRS